MTDNNHMQVFDKARVLYRDYGTVRGNATEFAYFKKTHRDWKDVLSLLELAIHEQVKWRARATGFVPPWKNFKTWLYNRCWEEEHPASTPSHGESEEHMAERKKADARRLYTVWLSDPKISQDEKRVWAKQNGYMWLVDEINKQTIT